MNSSIFSRSTNSIWIFGYGSLIHSPGFEVKRRVKGYVKDWKRVWHQGSTDHRGTLEYPGRTVTLKHDPGAITWGVAYELAGDQETQAKTLAYLEWREKQYDLRERVSVYGTPDQLETLRSPPDAQLGLPDGRSFLEGLEAQPQEGTQEPRKSYRQSSATAGHADDSNSPYVLLLEDVLCYIASSNKSTNKNYLGPATPDELALQIARAVGPSGPNWEYVAKLADAMRSMQIHDPELFELERQVARTMALLRRSPDHVDQGIVTELGSQLDGAQAQRLQALRQREEDFLAFHISQDPQS